MLLVSHEMVFIEKEAALSCTIMWERVRVSAATI